MSAARKKRRAKEKAVDKAIRQAKGDGKPHTAQDSIPFEVIYPDGICKLPGKSYSKSLAFDDINSIFESTIVGHSLYKQLIRTICAGKDFCDFIFLF